MNYTTAWCQHDTAMEGYRMQWIQEMKMMYDFDLKVDKKLWQPAVTKFWTEVLNLNVKKHF